MLTEHERRVVNGHPRAGAAVLRHSRALAGLAPLMVAHHERLDGEGDFPEYRDERTALAARVIAVCDRYEAMSAVRAYRPLLAPDQVWSLLDQAAIEPLSVPLTTNSPWARSFPSRWTRVVPPSRPLRPGGVNPSAPPFPGRPAAPLPGRPAPKNSRARVNQPPPFRGLVSPSAECRVPTLTRDRRMRESQPGWAS